MQRFSYARHKLKNGTIIYVEIHSHSIEYDNKNARLVLANDITDRLKAEKELLKLSRAVEQGPTSVAITAHAFEEDKQNALESGCEGFLTKPFTKKSLLDMIAEIGHKSKSRN